MISWTLGLWKNGVIPVHPGLSHLYQGRCSAWKACLCWVGWQVPGGCEWQQWHLPVVNYLWYWGAHMIETRSRVTLQGVGITVWAGWNDRSPWSFIHFCPCGSICPHQPRKLGDFEFSVPGAPLVVYWYQWDDGKGSVAWLSVWWPISSRNPWCNSWFWWTTVALGFI